MLLLEPNSREAVQQVARKIQEAVQAPLSVDGGVVLQPSVSIGVALFPEDGQTMEALMAAADAGMYAAKQQSRTSAPLL